MKKNVIAIVVAVFATPVLSDPPFGPVAILTGMPAVMDGDGLLFGDVEIRLQGIEAPEHRAEKGLTEPGGETSAQGLADLVRDKQVTCFLDGTTALGRPVAYCEVDGQDIGLLMVRQGHAIDCEIYSGGRYAEAEAQAKAEGRDLSQILGPAEYCAKT